MPAPTSRARTAPRATPPVRVDDAARRALRAWADVDRFEVPEVEEDDARGRRAVGTLHPDVLAPASAAPWPPRPVEDAPRREPHVLACLVLVGCVPRTRVEEDLLEAFADDLRLREAWRPPTGRRGRPRGRLTFRASFVVDATGRPVTDSLQYHPLTDFTDFAREHGAALGTSRVAADGLRHVEAREASLRARWDEVVRAGRDDDPRLVVRRLVELLHVTDPREAREVRFDARWVPAGGSLEVQPRSFYRDDLLAAADSPTSRAAAVFLTGRPGARPASTVDVESRAPREALLDPSRLPRAAWPGEHLPRLSQQVALAGLLEHDDPVVAVNGPPGTGKTTFLRDLYANALADRAAVMAGFDDPRDAFGPRQDVPLTSGGTRPFHPVVEALHGFELLVASSNNAAVANVSQEIPKLGEVDAAFRDALSYFRGASDPEDDGEVTRRGLLDGDAPTWGFGAATLGKRSLIGAFETVVGRYTAADKPGRHLLKLLKEGGSLADWQDARQRFTRAVAAVEEWIERTEQQRAGVRAAAEHLRDLERATRAVTDLDVAATDARTAAEAAERRVADARAAAVAAAEAVARSRQTRPGWWARVTGSPESQAWADADKESRQASAAAEKTLRTARTTATTRADERSAAERALETGQARRDDLQRGADHALAVLDGADPDRFVDDERWWSRDRDDLEQGTAWTTRELHALQAEVFAAAMAVHEQFARRAGKQLAADLRLWMHLKAGEVRAPANTQVALDAWRAFFLLVPLVSTTFASLARLLDGVPPGSLGWLVVDEAGQAQPAHAVGGLARFRRAVVVGDPQQLEPVVGLPDVLVDRLLAAHDAPAELAPTRGSVQRSADAVSRCGTNRQGTWVGLPLLVHNRCLDPMFSVSNEVAYDRDMVLGREKPAPAAASAVGDSRWIDVPRPDGPHFHDGDAAVVRDLLRSLDWTAAKPASVAVISPFRDVVRGVRRVVEEELRHHLPGASPEVLDARCRVGTVHTFQGQERNIVVLLLGGGSRGARQWAAGTPNLLNVAVTRAKDRLVVVGDRAAWHDVGCAEVLARWLPVVGTGAG
ncbi:DEAD/DEAH box helicase [Kineococcus sp. SYSU DK002]|uniref:DEAD/DEAH box helicase n=1 Tax=Kineococcus sp. SYSU DK002 TaxID=3383123 RepID=UPI003D7CE7FB